MKPVANITLLILGCLAAAALSGCHTRTSSALQNQYGPASAYTRAPVSIPDGYWISNKVVHPSFGMSTNWNLGVQVVDQREVGQARSLGKPNPMAAVGAVDRYQKGQVRPLSEISLQAGGGSQE